MEWIKTLVLFGHLVVAALIITLVLLQRGKGAEAGSGFGAGASGTVFGSRGTANFFSRATAVLATLFFATSLTLAYFSTQAPPEESVVGGAGASGTEIIRIDPDAVDSLDEDFSNPQAPEDSPADELESMPLVEDSETE